MRPKVLIKVNLFLISMVVIGIALLATHSNPMRAAPPISNAQTSTTCYSFSTDPQDCGRDSKLDGGETRATRLAFADGAFTPSLTKGCYAPLETQLIRTDSSPPQADGAFSGSS